MFSFDWTISVGNLLTAACVIGGWFYAFFQLKGDVRIIRHDQQNIGLQVSNMNESFKQVSSILTKVAVQEERFNSQRRSIENAELAINELRHGRGFVADGEWSRTGRHEKT